ncbi:hypothetical protein KA183_13210 [bacterium]|nr:hypothetical protein [bacterium]
MVKHYYLAPHWIDYGEYGDYCYFQSDIGFLDELIKASPEILEGKWALVTTCDGEEFLPPGGSSWLKEWTSGTKQLEPNFVLPISGECDEIYFFDNKINLDDLRILTESLQFLEERLSEADPSRVAESWKILKAVNASAYFSATDTTLIIFKNKEAAACFQQTDFYKSIPELHLSQMVDYERSWRNQPTVNEKCIQDGCNENRLQFGVNCPTHHHNMLLGQELP